MSEADEPIELQPGQSAGAYRVDSVLSRGRTSVLYAVSGPSGSPWRLQVFMGTGEAERAVIADWVEEQRAVRRAGVLTPREVVQTDAGIGVLQDRATGSSLHTWAQSPRTEDDWNALVRALLDVLERAHTEGVHHLGLSPENIYVHTDPSGSLNVQVTEWGLWYVLEELGKPWNPRYAAPEQLLPRVAVGTYSDLFSVGVLLYEGRLGRLPFTGETDADVRHAVLGGRYAPPQSLKSDLTHAWDQFLRGLLAVDISERLFTVAEARIVLAGGERPIRPRGAVQLMGTPPPVVQDQDATARSERTERSNSRSGRSGRTGPSGRSDRSGRPVPGMVPLPVVPDDSSEPTVSGLETVQLTGRRPGNVEADTVHIRSDAAALVEPETADAAAGDASGSPSQPTVPRVRAPAETVQLGASNSAAPRPDAAPASSDPARKNRTPIALWLLVAALILAVLWLGLERAGVAPWRTAERPVESVPGTPPVASVEDPPPQDATPETPVDAEPGLSLGAALGQGTADGMEGEVDPSELPLNDDPTAPIDGEDPDASEPGTEDPSAENPSTGDPSSANTGATRPDPRDPQDPSGDGSAPVEPESQEIEAAPIGVEGDADQVWLERSGERFEGAVPPGDYAIRAVFAGQSVFAGVARVSDGGATIVCSAAWERCRVRD